MRRYAKLHAGRAGSPNTAIPDNPEDWAFLKEISAYHTAVPGRPYPPILMRPAGAMIASIPVMPAKWRKLQAMGYEPTFTSPPPGTRLCKDN